MSKSGRLKVIQEEKAEFSVGNTFYRPKSKIIRDLGVLAAILYQQEQGVLRVLDAMSASGVRSLRYWLESKADFIWANDSNPEIKETLNRNIQNIIPENHYKITYQDANRLFFHCYQTQDYYDLIDVDGFGSPSPIVNSALWATKIGGLLYLTSTDGRIGTGHLPENSLRIYGAYARCHPCAHEQVLRLMIGRVQQIAASMELGIKPVFSLFTGSTYRIMVRLLPFVALNEENYGFLGYCHHCGQYQVLSWSKLGRVVCSQDGESLIVTGPMWLGALHDDQAVKRMQSLAIGLNWLKQAHLLGIMADEANLPPYFYTLREIGQRGKMDLPKRAHLIRALQLQGYEATVTHINPQALKTNASLAICIKSCFFNGKIHNN